jgi:hypothetical protein
LRRIIVIGTALAALAGGGIALAAGGQYDKFGATQTFTPNAAGSTAHPSPLSLKEHWTAKATNGGAAAPLTKIVAKVYGLQYNGKHFAKCTASQINKANGHGGKWDNVCPKSSYIGGGPVKATVTPPSGGAGAPCDPYLRIFNGGAKTQTFFFVVSPWKDKWGTVPSNATCTGAKTGTSCAAYSGTLSHSGKTAVLTINLPPCASTHAAGFNVYAALIDLKVTYKKLTTKVHGKTIGYAQSVACKGGKRPWSFAFTYQHFKPSNEKQTETVKGSQKCK